MRNKPEEAGATRRVRLHASASFWLEEEVFAFLFWLPLFFSRWNFRKAKALQAKPGP